MANFQFDQAEGLRRILAGPTPRIFSFFSAEQNAGHTVVLMNLSASLARAGSGALLLDARPASRGAASRIDAAPHATLLQAANGERSLAEAVRMLPQGFGIATLTRGALPDAARQDCNPAGLAALFDTLAATNDIILIDAELDANDALPLAAIANGEIVVQVSDNAASIKDAYAIIKRLYRRLGRRSFNVLVTGVSEQRAQAVYQNIAQTASRYLGLQLSSIGSVPADEHLDRAAHLGRPVVDAFPLARASVAFRRLAGRFGEYRVTMPAGAAMAGSDAPMGA